MLALGAFSLEIRASFLFGDYVELGRREKDGGGSRQAGCHVETTSKSLSAGEPIYDRGDGLRHGNEDALAQSLRVRSSFRACLRPCVPCFLA